MKRFLHLNLLLFLLGVSAITYAETVKLSIRNIRSEKGIISIGLYKDNASFQDDKPFKKIKISKSTLKGGVLNYSLELPAGNYGIALLDDENKNNEMDSNFIGVPIEGYGFSGYQHSGMFRPSFNDFNFYVKKEAVTRVNIDVDYF